jgi:hypothetical protein
MFRHLVTVCVCAGGFLGLVELGDVLVPSADGALLSAGYGNSAEWSGTSRKPHTLEFIVAYTAEEERSVTISVAEGTHPDQLAHQMVVAWASTYCDTPDAPVYHDGAKVIFPSSGGSSISGMKVKITESATASPTWTSLSTYETIPVPAATRVYYDDFISVKNANTERAGG